MNFLNLTAATKLVALQVLTQLTLVLLGTPAKEACVVTCVLTALAPLYSEAASKLYREAFGALVNRRS